MKGCLLLIVGAVIGVIALVVVQTFVTTPSPLPAAAPTNTDVVILFRNAFLTRTLNTQLSQGQALVGNGLTFDRVIVQGGADQTLTVVGTASTQAVSVSVPIRVVLRPSMSNNRVSIQIVRAELGVLTIPGQVFSQIEGPINVEINRTLATSAYRIVNVSTTVDGLVVDLVLTN